MISYDFRCDECGYTERVAGGRDPLRLCVRETMACSDCKRLVDVLVTVREPDKVGEQWSQSSFYEELRAAPRGVCPHCGGSTLQKWGRGSTLSKHGLFRRVKSWGPCPRCGAAISTTTNSYRTD